MVNAVGQRIAALGFSVIRDYGDGQHFTRPALPALDYEIHLDVQQRGAAIHINPSLGIRHAETSRLSSEFLGLQPSRVCSIGTGLDDVLRRADVQDLNRWIATDETQIDAIGARVAADIGSFAMPYLLSFRRIEDVVAALGAKGRSVFENEHLAILNALLGRMPAATTALAAVIETASTQPSFVAAQTWKFVRSFTRHFGIDPAWMPHSMPDADESPTR